MKANKPARGGKKQW